MLDSEIRRKGRGVAGVELGVSNGDGQASNASGGWFVSEGGGLFWASSESEAPAGLSVRGPWASDSSQGKSLSVSVDELLSAESAIVAAAGTCGVWGPGGSVRAAGGSRLWLKTSREVRHSISLACDSAARPGEESGQGRPTDAARPDVLCALCRSEGFCFSLLGTGVFSCDGPEFDRYLSTRDDAALSFSLVSVGMDGAGPLGILYNLWSPVIMS